ncbi:dihydrodipicolinate synthase family protein [Blastopirellula sp. JC732]|uniref:Dihydrodipicolinate synthase family protein n=1 Tax=Blastopirellula sediminis TaxID=2894196 RepID=A0A9X1SHF2_9BACT|nr:dihydrodipicolinate synthase family protein [Blastopirellula sediminis]MCC9605550.1 dihydrodipicolinate synthase family protein [Blastopirellula sediminis]MCC9631150.1 dihydrodipicolinate synthase family protein [Blastopirellula sediminis]
MPTRLISAICTPVDFNGDLHVAGLAAHIEAQIAAGIDGLLVAGTMGLMQLQTDATYQRLIDESVGIVAGRTELWVGVGDAGYQRTLERIRIAERQPVDGLVILTPYLMKFDEEELLRYYLNLADAANKPLFLYDLPGLTGTALSMELIEQVVAHPNIHGLKCTRTWEWTVELWERFGGKTRVVPAQPERVADLVRLGVPDNLDGLFAIFPNQSRALADAADRGEWEEAASLQADLNSFLEVIRAKHLFGAVTCVMNEMGTEGLMAPEPYYQLSAEEKEAFLSNPTIHRVIANELKLAVAKST